MLLSLFGVTTWRAVPVMPVEIMLLPKWFPFHIDKISYWARTVIVPLLVLQALKPKAKNPKGIAIDELFLKDPQDHRPEVEGAAPEVELVPAFQALDAVLRVVEPMFPKSSRQRAIDKAVEFVTERLNGEDGLGAIFPAMANSAMMYQVLGYPSQHPDYVAARTSVDKLLIVKDDEAYCQPCMSPVWDTGLVCHTLLEVGTAASGRRLRRRLELAGAACRCSTCAATGSRAGPDVRPGGWAFQYANPHYPDLDDTAVVVMAMDRTQKVRGNKNFQPAIDRGREWICGLQSQNGGWGAFDADNEYLYLNNIPFADHGALLDPPTEDVTGRCVSMLAQLGEASTMQVRDGVDYLRRTQLAEGSWYGRWGMNYIYGTWSVLCALNAAGLPPDAPEIKKARDWLISIQNSDGGWGEDGTSYKLDYRGYENAPSTASQTAWALIGLMAAGAADHPAVAKGIDYLLAHAGNRRPVGRGALHRDRVPAGVLPSLPRLSEILSALGAGALQPSPGRPIGRVRDVDAAIFAIAGGCGHRPDLRGADRRRPRRRHGLRRRPPGTA